MLQPVSDPTHLLLSICAAILPCCPLLCALHLDWHMLPPRPALPQAVVPVRKALKVRTAFNLLGPMLNPADAQYGLVGVYSTSVSHLMADALQVRMHWGARGWSVGCWGELHACTCGT